jgi:hypothetical protein
MSAAVAVPDLLATAQFADHPHRFFKPVSIDRWVVVIYESDYISVHCLIFSD